jgi:two-component system, chemotaxis family, chemotaxis protein CheY
MTSPAKRVLLVDDSGSIRRMLEWILKPLGLETVHAGDGMDALDLLGRQSVDLAIVDLNMPRLDGISFVRELRANAAWGDLPVILMTTERREEDVQRALDAGVNLYLVKPSTPTVIRYKVLSLLGLPPAGEDPR